jgi:hypothetical protein
LTLDLQRQLDTATAFFLAAERCVPAASFSTYGVHSVSAPTMVNYAFSVELALKVIHGISRGVSMRGHKLNELYQALPGDVKANLPHLAQYSDEIASQFEDWRYPYEQELLIGSIDDARRAFVECYREIRRMRPGFRSVYEEMWGTFEPDWFNSEVRAIVVDIPAS